MMIVLLSATAVVAQEDDLKKGDDLFAKGKYEESLGFYTKAIDSDPENLTAVIHRGLAYGMAGKYDMAVEDYNKVLEQKPELMNVRNSRGSAYMKLKKYDKALEDFNAIIGADPKDQEAYNNRGWCKKHLGDQKGACDDWKQSKKLGNSEAKLILENGGC